jgi:hypothetical protein
LKKWRGDQDTDNDAGYINTRVAYEVWGLEIEDLEARLKNNAASWIC